MNLESKIRQVRVKSKRKIDNELRYESKGLGKASKSK